MMTNAAWKWLLWGIPALVCCQAPHKEVYPAWRNTPMGEEGLRPWESSCGEFPLCGDSRYNEIVTRCGQTLRSTAGTREAENAQMVLLENDLPHAESLPGGRIVIFSGFLGEMRHEAELAFVLAHELGHVQARHPEKEQDLLRTAAGQRDTAARRIRCELEADREGLLLMARAGYDPRVGLRFWDRFTGTQQAILMQQLSDTHPSHEERIRALNALLPEAMLLYHAAPQKHGAGRDISRRPAGRR